MAPFDPLSPFSVKNTNGNNGKQRRLRFKQKLKLLKKLPSKLKQKLQLILSSNCSMKEKRHTRHCLRKKIAREARRKEKAERAAIAEKILEEHLIKMIGINIQYSNRDRAGYDPNYSELELEFKLGTELDFEEGIDIEEFRNSGLSIEEFRNSGRRSKDSDYAAGTSGQPIKKKPKVPGPYSVKLKRKSKRKVNHPDARGPTTDVK